MPESTTERLIFHASPEAGSFLEMLKPYRGLREDVLQDLSRALRAAAPELSAETLPRTLVSALFAISRLARGWALDPDGPLRRSGGISDAELVRLGEFMRRFDVAVLMALEGELDDSFADWP